MLKMLTDKFFSYKNSKEFFFIRLLIMVFFYILGHTAVMFGIALTCLLLVVLLFQSFYGKLTWC